MLCNSETYNWERPFFHLLFQARKWELREGKCFSTEDSELAAFFSCRRKWRSSRSGGNCQTNGKWSSALGKNSRAQTPLVWSTRMPQAERQKWKTHHNSFIHTTWFLPPLAWILKTLLSVSPCQISLLTFIPYFQLATSNSPLRFPTGTTKSTCPDSTSSPLTCFSFILSSQGQFHGCGIHAKKDPTPGLTVCSCDLEILNNF